MAVSDAISFLNANQRRHMEELFSLLRFPSIAHSDEFRAASYQAADWLANYLSRRNFDVKIVESPGRPFVLGRSAHIQGRPTVLLYGHYDVQPAEPLELWKSDPFEPAIREGAIYCRGADDDKGQLFAQLMAIDAWCNCGGLPVNMIVLLDGEEECGSPNLEKFLADNAGQLKADVAVISDTDFFANGVPTIAYAMRGMVGAEIIVNGPSADCHSGLHGGAVLNPLNALTKIVASMHDKSGKVTIPGFYDDVIPATEQELADWASLPFDERQYAESMGVPMFGGGELGRTVLERRWARPTLECNGFAGGYQGDGMKTVIPATAAAKISMRLVCNQDPQKIADAFVKFVADATPHGVTSRTVIHNASAPVMIPRDWPPMKIAADALTRAFDAKTVFVRNGASLPVTEKFQRMLGLNTVLLGFGLPDDAIHSPNERFALEQLYKGSQAAARFIGSLAEAKF